MYERIVGLHCSGGDDNEVNVDILVDSLSDFYDVSVAMIEKIYLGKDVPYEEKSSFDRHPRVGYELLNKIRNLQRVPKSLYVNRIWKRTQGIKGVMKWQISSGSEAGF